MPYPVGANAASFAMLAERRAASSPVSVGSLPTPASGVGAVATPEGLPSFASVLGQVDTSAASPEVARAQQIVAAVSPESQAIGVANGAITGGALSSDAVSGAGGASAPSFTDRVRDFLGRVEGLEERADQAADGYIRGEHADVHGTMIAMEEADVSFRLATSIRNRAIEAYREVMRMGA